MDGMQFKIIKYWMNHRSTDPSSPKKKVKKNIKIKLLNII